MNQKIIHDLLLLETNLNSSFYLDKAKFETLNNEALTWFADTIRSCVHSKYLNESQPDHDDGYSVIIVHGAGSFGHIQAKQNGLKGQSSAPLLEQSLHLTDRRKMMYGLSKVRSR
jgi:isopentenyl phosphate kinase